jgi:hypothetical protein
MAEVAKSGTPSLATLEPGYEHQLNGIIAGEALAVGDFVYIRASDGRAMKATGAAANEAARARGVVLQAAAIGNGVSIHHGIVVRWGASLVPGTPYFLSGTVAGQLADVASTGGTAPIAFAVDATRIYVMSPR